MVICKVWMLLSWVSVSKKAMVAGSLQCMRNGEIGLQSNSG